MIHQKTSNRNYWDFRGKEGWSIGVALDQYICQFIIPQNTKADQVSDTMEFCHQSTTTPLVTPEDWILHGLNTITSDLTDAPTAQSDAQIQVSIALCNDSASWASSGDTPTPAATIPLHYTVYPRWSTRF